MRMERTLAMLKPDAYERGLLGEAITRIEQAGFKITELRRIVWTDRAAANFYGVHKGKDFFKRNLRFILSGPCVAMVLLKENAVADLRKLIGPTDCSVFGTIRGDLGKNDGIMHENIIHASDSPDNAEWEIYQIFGGH